MDRIIGYKLEGHTPVPVTSMEEWAKTFDIDNRRVALTEMPNGDRISTVFLAMDHGWRSPVPILFETMIFGGEHDQYCERYATWEEAEEGHKRAVELYERGFKTDGSN